MSTNSVETHVGTDTATTFQAGETEATSRDNSGTFLEIGEKVEAETPETPEVPETTAAPETPETPEVAVDAPPPPEPLPEFDAEKPEVVEAYQARFLDADKKLSREAISVDFWQARKEDPNAYLAPGTMAWATGHFGVDEQFVKDVCDGLLQNNATREAATFASLAPEGTPEAGRVEAGKQTLSAAAKWARDGGYTADQAKAFNTLAAKGGPEYQDAMELLIARHKAAAAKATPTAPVEAPRRPASPQRVVSGAGAETVTVTPYATRAEYRADRQAAGTDPAKVSLTRQRASISNFG